MDLLQLNIKNTSIDRVSDFDFLNLALKECLNRKYHMDKLAH